MSTWHLSLFLSIKKEIENYQLKKDKDKNMDNRKKKEIYIFVKLSQLRTDWKFLFDPSFPQKCIALAS